MTTGSNNVYDVISALKELDKVNSFEVYIPSKQQNIPFKQLNTDQLKRLVKTVIDSPIYNTQFITTFNSIIKENVLQENIVVDELTIYDKLLFFIKVKIESLSPEYTFNFTEEEVIENEYKGNTYTVNVANNYNEFIKNVPIIEPITIDYKNFSITCSLPTISTENKLEKELHKNNKIEITTPEELRITIGDTFINEITKYISEITIDNKNLDLKTIDFKNRIKVVEQLPTNVINGVLKYIENYKKTISKLITVTIETKTGSIEKEIPLDATFFNV